MLYDWKYPFNEKLGKLMKKNRIFIFIMALMMTLLLVVGCDVSPVANNNLIRASVNISDSRDLQVVGGDGNIAYYKIAMIPEWSETSVDEQIVGKKGSRDENGNITSWEDVSYSKENGNVAIDLGYISQGKWSIYINAYNKENALIYSGNTNGYISKDNDNISIILARANDKQLYGYIGFFITLNQLFITDTELVGTYGLNYGLKYEVYSLDGNMVLDKDIDNYLKVYSLLDNKINFGSWNESIRFAADDYYVTIKLVKDPKKSSEEVIGGITRFVSVYPGSSEDAYSWTMIHGEVVPSDFIQVGIDFPAPDIIATMSYVNDGGKYTFTCAHKYDTAAEGFVRYYRWFIDGELVSENKEYAKWVTSGISINSSNGQEESVMECTFLGYGDREVRCEVVYVPEEIANVDTKPLHFVGGASSYISVLPVTN